MLKCSFFPIVSIIRNTELAKCLKNSRYPYHGKIFRITTIRVSWCQISEFFRFCKFMKKPLPRGIFRLRAWICCYFWRLIREITIYTHSHVKLKFRSFWHHDTGIESFSGILPAPYSEFLRLWGKKGNTLISKSGVLYKMARVVCHWECNYLGRFPCKFSVFFFALIIMLFSIVFQFTSVFSFIFFYYACCINLKFFK